MKQAVVRVARLFNATEPIPAGETRFQRGSMRPLPGSGVPLVIDHDLERQIGVVEEIVEWDGTWLAARCKVTEDAGWPHVGTGASWGYSTLQRQTIGAGERILSAILEEVTLTVALTPVNAGASVVLLRDIAPPRVSVSATGVVDEDAWLDHLLDLGWDMADAVDHIRRERGYPASSLDRRGPRRVAA